MKRSLLGLLLLGLTGCVQVPESVPTTAPRSPGPLLPLGKSVTADMITPANAHALAQMLWDEYDRETLELEKTKKQGP